MMKKGQQEPKPRAVSDGAQKNRGLDPDEPHFRERSFTDVFAVFAKKQKVSKKDASTNTTPLEEMYPPVPPPLPPKIHHYYMNEVLNKIEVNYEDAYNEVRLERNMNVEPGLWVTTPATEATYLEPSWEREQIEDGTDEEEEEEEEEKQKEPPKSTTTHKRNISGWSLGSFHIGTPVELMNEVLRGSEWARFLPEDMVLSPSQESEEPTTNTCDFETTQELSKDAVDGKSTEEGSTSRGSSVDDILKSVKIIEEKVETPKVSPEEPDPHHILPPKLNPSSAAGIDKRFRSSVFYRYKLPPAGEEPPPETTKSGHLILEKIKAKLRKSSMDELKEVEK